MFGATRAQTSKKSPRFIRRKHSKNATVEKKKLLRERHHDGRKGETSDDGDSPLQLAPAGFDPGNVRGFVEP